MAIDVSTSETAETQVDSGQLSEQEWLEAELTEFTIAMEDGLEQVGWSAVGGRLRRGLERFGFWAGSDKHNTIRVSIDVVHVSRDAGRTEEAPIPDAVADVEDPQIANPITTSGAGGAAAPLEAQPQAADL